MSWRGLRKRRRSASGTGPRARFAWRRAPAAGARKPPSNLGWHRPPSLRVRPVADLGTASTTPHGFGCPRVRPSSARACCRRAKAAFKSWLASPTFASSASSCGSWNSVHHAPRFWLSTGSAELGARLLQARESRLQILVGIAHLRFECVQLRILEQRPPRPTVLVVHGFGGLPVAGLLVCIRGRHAVRSPVDGSEGARRQRADEQQRCTRERTVHVGLLLSFEAAGGGGEMRTSTPSVSESGGLRITTSSGSTPESISMVLPKS